MTARPPCRCATKTPCSANGAGVIDDRFALGHEVPVVRLALIAGYAAVLFVPLALMTGVMKAGDQARLVVFADGLGFAALSALALQILVSGRWATTTRSFGLRSVLSLHRQ